MIKKAFIQEKGNKVLEAEQSLVISELDKRQIPFTLFTEKKMTRRQLPLDRESLVVGDIPTVESALKQLEILIPQENSYPKSLQPFLHRKVWKSTVFGLEELLTSKSNVKIFAKPSSKRKRFTGRVFETEGDLQELYGISRRDEILCAEAVLWRSEYRVYVVNSEIRAVKYYGGDKQIQVNLGVIAEAIQILNKAGESKAGYAIDFGVLESGETALIEFNDGYSVGAYEVEAKDYTDMIIARWEELLSI